MNSPLTNSVNVKLIKEITVDFIKQNYQQELKIVPAALGNWAGVAGAACLARKELNA